MTQENMIISKTKPLLEYIKKRQEDKKFIRSVEVTATFFTIAFFLIFAIKPTATTISALIGEINSKQILVKDMRRKINSLVIAQDNYSTIQGRYSIIESSLPDSPHFYHSANQLRLSARESQLDLNSFSFSLNDQKESDSKNNSPKALNNSQLKSYSAPISQSTDFINALVYLSRLQDSRRLIDLLPISIINKIDKNKEGTPSSNLTLNFSAKLFYWQNNEEK